MMNTLKAIVEAINSSKTILITAHEGPDGDAVGSSLGLASFLRGVGKNVTVYLKDQVPELYAFLPGADTVRQDIPEDVYDLAFVLDVGEKRRAGSVFCAFTDFRRCINIDHHLTCENFGDINLIDIEAAATGVLICRIIREYGYRLDRDTALCLYVAIITDTGSFRYSNANREAFPFAGELI